MLSSSLPHLWNFLLPLRAPARISRFRVCFPFQSLLSKCFRFHIKFNRFHIPAQYETAKKSRQVYFVSYFIDLCCRQGMVWNGMEDDFSIFHAGNFLPFHTQNLPFHFIQKFSSIFHSILPYRRKLRLEAMQRIFWFYASWQCCKQPLVKER